MIRSPSPGDLKLLGGISLSPEVVSLDQSPVQLAPPLSQRGLGGRGHDDHHEPLTDGSDSPLRFRQASSISLGIRNAQWEMKASPPENILRMSISDDDEGVEVDASLEAEAEAEAGSDADMKAMSRPLMLSVPEMEEDVSYSFEPGTVEGRRALVYDILSDSDDEQ